jgi:uncharacterized protein (DUF362 family)
MRVSRRRFLAQAAAAAAVSRALMAQTPPGLPSVPVAVARCRRYDYDLVRSTLSTLFDQLGGIGTLVGGKTVTVKVNLTGGWNTPVYTLSPVETVYTHPIVVLAACSLFKSSGAQRIVICEGLSTTAPGRYGFQESGYDVATFESMIPGILWENTHNRGTSATYRQVDVGAQPYLYNRFTLNYRYVDTDVMVSIPKMKNHQIAGVTLAMKNLFGITPSSLYSSSSANEGSTSARIPILHAGGLSAAGGEVLPVPSYAPGYRVPRAVVDIVSARPIDLAIVDAVVSMHGGEGAWQGTRTGLVTPGLLIAGRNCVCVDAVSTAVMGYDPEAVGGAKPFYNGANSMALAAARGIGTNRLSEIEVRGLSVAEARYDFLPTLKE